MKDVQKHLERAIEINPEFADAHLELALLLVEQENYKKARKHFEKTDNRLGEKIGYVKWPQEYSLEIDTPLDFKFAEQIYNNLNS